MIDRIKRVGKDKWMIVAGGVFVLIGIILTSIAASESYVPFERDCKFKTFYLIFVLNLRISSWMFA